MVNVARSVEMGVDLRAGRGTWRGVLLCTVANERACVRALETCPRTDRPVEGLMSCDSILIVGNDSVVVTGRGRRLSVY
jgi:hypothetical protein